MNEKKMYDLLNNSKESNIERLTEGKKVMTDAERERIFAMSKNKLNNMKRMAANNGSAEYVNSDYVNGVENYNKPIIMKFAGMAAAAVLLIGGIGGGALMAHRMNGNRPGDVDLLPAATNAATSASSYTTAANTYTTAVNTVTTITEVDGTAAGEQKHSTESSVQNNTSEAETAPKTSVKTTEAVIEPAKTTAAPAVSAEDQELIDVATRLTDDYPTLFRVKHGWLTYDENDYLSLESQVISSPVGGLPYYRVTDERFNTIEKIRTYMASHCTTDSSLYMDVDKIDDIDTVGELITENTEYKNYYRVSDDYYTLYFIKDGKLYVTWGQLGFNFEGWCDQPVEIISKSDNEFVAKRGHYSMEYVIYYDTFTFRKDPATGNWLIASQSFM